LLLAPNSKFYLTERYQQIREKLPSSSLLLADNLILWSIYRLTMQQDLAPFLLGVACLVLYLVFSAWTEMGTKLPWKKKNEAEKK